ncbi:unnamed protein product [Phytophthora fragariaefolia]|uniref:5-formyltetrahydrofolate cyclo-ligase n=1 Tax=Phytophthora fragariaefolia TaxID=1490495 RepID=A0A9W6XJ58_9STRA|nr:unnamed protein product [Phytophthora fragariaefolia]
MYQTRIEWCPFCSGGRDSDSGTYKPQVCVRYAFGPPPNLVQDWALSGAMASSSSEDMAAALKKELRRRIGAELKALPDAEVAEQSRRLAERVCALPEFARARGVSVYLEMPKEAATGGVLAAAFAAEKLVFVPKITGRSAEDMRMLRAQSVDDICRFPKVGAGAADWLRAAS